MTVTPSGDQVETCILLCWILARINNGFSYLSFKLLFSKSIYSVENSAKNVKIVIFQKSIKMHAWISG